MTLYNMGMFGSAIGGSIGALGGKIIGGMLPFKTGGKVQGKKGKPVKAILHGGEYVLPANAKPTKAQKAIVAKNKRGKK
jgi:hypothetical protein